MKSNTKNRRFVIAIMLVAVVLITIGGTFAYFLTQAGRNEEQKLTIKTGNLALTFEDNDDGLNERIMVGESVEKLFIIRNTGTQPVTTNMIWNGLVNTYIEESLSYTLEFKTSETGTNQPLETAHTNVPQSDRADDYNLAKDITIPAGATYYYKLTITFNNLPDINQEADRTAILSTKFNLGDSIDETITSYRVLRHLKLNKKEETPNFAVTPTTDETANGLYSMEDDYGTSYYFRGAVENNYVKFGGFFWRIIRINGDGSIRMQYDGTQAWPNANGQETFTTSGTNRFTHTDIAWHSMADDAKYVGWMFGGANETASTSKAQAQINQTDSNIKKQVDTWYKANIVDKNLNRYIGDEIFCNDRSTAPDGSTWDSRENSINKGFGNNFTIFGAFYRSYIENPQTPTATFICPQKNDAFTVSDTTKGNGSLTYPVGLITADEVMAAGSGRIGYDSRYYYLYKSSDYYYWLFSPCNFNTYASIQLLTWAGSLNGNATTFNRNPVHTNKIAAVAPVINIAPEYAKTMVGDGSMTSPYQIPEVE